MENMLTKYLMIVLKMNNVTGILNKMLSFLKIKKKRKLKAKE
jgi:hypothetical protein